MKNILVFFGGRSTEHDVSIITGVLTLNSIDKTKFLPIPIYITKSGEWFTGDKLKNIEFFKNFNEKGLKKVRLGVSDGFLYELKKSKLKKLYAISGALNCMHGKNGEDGALCGILQLNKIPLASPNAFCSMLSMDKSLSKKILSSLDVLTVEGVTVMSKDYFAKKETVMLDIVNKLSYPVIVKPSSLGSSIGISVAKNFVELENSLKNAFFYDNEVLCEKYLDNAIDINCAVYKIGEKILVSECEKPVTANEILTFSDKYLGSKNGLSREFPANIKAEVSNKIKETTKFVYESLGFSGIIRIDYLLHGDTVYLNEINSVPGSMAYYLFCDTISSFTDLLTDLLNDSFISFIKKDTKTYEYDSKIILDKIKGVKK